MSKQCAAESSHLSAMTMAPHLCSFRRSHRLACHGHSPRAAPLPPTILLKAVTDGEPQSAGGQGETAWSLAALRSCFHAWPVRPGWSCKCLQT